jgi:tetratricopeptide (TPR) repeat protein
MSNHFFADNNCKIFAEEVSQDLSKNLVVTPAQMQLLERANQLIEKITNREDKLSKLFDLLTFESRFKDKQLANKTIQDILKIIPQLESVKAKTNFYELLALAQANIGEYNQAARTIENLTQAIDKAQIQFDVAEKIMYDMEEENLPVPNEINGLLLNAIDCAKAAKDTKIQALAASRLGHILGKSGNRNDAKQYLLAAIQLSDQLDEADSKSIKMLTIRDLVQNGFYTDATTTVMLSKNSELRDMLLSSIVRSLAESGKIEEAKKNLNDIKSENIKDHSIIELSREIAKKGTTEELLILLSMMSSAERKNIFMLNVITFLLDNNRKEIATKMIEQCGIPKESGGEFYMVMIGQIIKDKKFDEAAKQIESIKDINYKYQMQRHLVFALIKSEGLNNAIKKTNLSYPDEDIKLIADLNENAKKNETINDVSAKIISDFALLIKSTEIMYLNGIQTTSQVLLNDIDKLSDPQMILEYQYNIARLHLELGNCDGVRDALNHSVKFLDGTKDLMKLKGLVQIQNNNTEKSDLKQNAPNETNITEAMIKERLFLIYTSICAMYIDINDLDNAKKLFAKSKEFLAPTDADPIIQFEQTGILSRLLLQVEK